MESRAAPHFPGLPALSSQSLRIRKILSVGTVALKKYQLTSKQFLQFLDQYISAIAERDGVIHVLAGKVREADSLRRRLSNAEERISDLEGRIGETESKPQ